MISIATARGIALMVVVALIFGLGFAAGYRWLALDFATYREDQAKALVAAQNEIAAAKASEDRRIADLDRTHTEELANAQAEIERLRDAVADGSRRLRIAARCPRMPAAESAASVDDGGTPELTGAAERNYWRLRERIQTLTAQLKGLQAYVRAIQEGDGHD